jgi:hypothetical protein
LGGAQQVAPAQYDRDRLQLDRGGYGVFLLRNSAQQLGTQAEAFEGRGNDVSPEFGLGGVSSTGSGR